MKNCIVDLCMQGLCLYIFSYAWSNPLQQPNSLQNSLLAAGIPSLRDFDMSLSPLLTTQSMPTRHITSLSSIGGQTISMSEVSVNSLNSTKFTHCFCMSVWFLVHNLAKHQLITFGRIVHCHVILCVCHQSPPHVPEDVGKLNYSSIYG